MKILIALALVVSLSAPAAAGAPLEPDLTPGGIIRNAGTGHYRFILDNRDGQVPATYTMHFTRRLDRERRVLTQTVMPGDVFTTNRKWIRRGTTAILAGNGELVHLRIVP